MATSEESLSEIEESPKKLVEKKPEHGSQEEIAQKHIADINMEICQEEKLLKMNNH